MTLSRKITLIAVTSSIIWFVASFVYALQYKVRHIPEAYAAWDTGTLLVEYMKLHDRRWPSSWDELLTVVAANENSPIMSRGSRPGDTNFFFSLRQKVAIDWKFDTSKPNQNLPVTRLDGTKFPVLFENPNQMIRDYLEEPVNSNAPDILPANNP